jgi:hypothetical protein
MQTHGGVEVLLHVFLASVLDEMSASLYLRGKNPELQYHLGRMLGRPRSI